MGDFFTTKETAKDRQSYCKELQPDLPAGQAWMPIEARHSGWPGVHLCKLACKSEHRANPALYNRAHAFRFFLPWMGLGWSFVPPLWCKNFPDLNL